MKDATMRRWTGGATLLLAALTGCTTTSLREAPIVDRSERRSPVAAPVAAPQAAAREAPDGQYVVQRGDTLYSIALAFGQDHRDLARWNGLEDPSRLQVGQTLRVAQPADIPDGAVVAAVPVAPAGAAEVRPIDGATSLPPVPTTAPPTVAPPSLPAPPPVAPVAAPPKMVEPPAKTSSPTAVAKEPTLTWAWPASGKVIENFDEARNKGIGIAGKEGDPVLAANDGEVVYGGDRLRGYGNLIIIKHTDDFISAYAHNRQILVKQGQVVKRGQRIAEMGKTDSDIPKLHFEVRRAGKPIDPLKFLPDR
jgi:lipoprotein NlpD